MPGPGIRSWGGHNVDPSAPGWYPDPTGRHERRYWSGIRWSRHVDDAGQRADDPLDTGPVPVTTLQSERPRAAAQPRPAQPERPDRPERPERPEHLTEADWAGERRRPIGLLIAAVAALVLVAAAVVLLTQGGSDDPPEATSDDDPVVAAVERMMLETSGGSITDVEATCMADGVVRSVSRERLIEVGVLDGVDLLADLSTAEKGIAIPRAFDCLEDDTLIEFMVQTWPAEGIGNLGPEIAPCTFQGWYDRLGRERLVFMFTTMARVDPPPLDATLSTEEFEAATAVLAECQPTSETPPTT